MKAQTPLPILCLITFMVGVNKRFSGVLILMVFPAASLVDPIVSVEGRRRDFGGELGRRDADEPRRCCNYNVNTSKTSPRDKAAKR
jgi:hypothetical protein